MIRRPLFLGTLGFCGAILISYFLGKAAALGVLGLLVFAWWQWRQAGDPVGPNGVRAIRLQSQKLRKHGTAILMVFYVVSLVNVQLYELQRDPFAELEENGGAITTTATGTVLNSSIRTSGSGDEYLQMTVWVQRIGEREVSRRWYERPVRLLVKQYPERGTDFSELTPVSPGTQLRITGKVELPSGRRNPNCFDYQLYLKTIGIERVMTAQTIHIKEESHSLQGWLFQQKEQYLHQLKGTAGESAAGLMRGILFGEKTEIEEDTLEEFQRNGTAHILAVSGLHIGILYGVLGRLWRGKKGWLYFWMVTIVLIGYSFLASFSPSVVRASVMIVLHLYAKVRHLRYDLGSASFVVLLMILLKNPMQLFHTGLQMSFLAVLTLSAAAPFFRTFYQGIFLSSGVVQLGLLPYTAYVFNYVSLAAVFINVPIIFLAGFLVPLGIGGFVLSLILLEPTAVSGVDLVLDAAFKPVIEIMGQAIDGLCGLLTSCNSMTCIKGVTSFEVTSPPRALLAGYYLMLLLFLSEEGRLLILRKRKKAVAALICLCLAAAAIFGQVTATGFENASIVFVDVGQGDCMHIKVKDGKNYLVDGGGKIDYDLGKKTLKPYLLKNGVRRLDGAFVTHLHTDHYKGVAELCREGMVKKLFLYEGNRDKTEQICQETGMSAEDLVFLRAGQTVLLDDEGSAKSVVNDMRSAKNMSERVEVLWPQAGRDAGTALQKRRLDSEEEDENETSLIMKIHAGGLSLLVTGDIDAACEDRLAAKYRNGLKTDLLKVAHHGSRYSWSEDFARYAKPQAAVFQVGKNNYGHPNGEIIENYKRMEAGIWRNDLQGAVGFSCRQGNTAAGKKRLEVVTMLP